MYLKNDQFDSICRCYGYPTKSPRIAFRDDGTSTVRHLVRDVIHDYRAGKLDREGMRVIPVLGNYRARISTVNPLVVELGGVHLGAEPRALTSIPVNGGIHLLPTMGTLAVQTRETFGLSDEDARFVMMSTRRLVSGYYAYSQEHHIASPMMLLDEFVMTPLAAVGIDRMVLTH